MRLREHYYCAAILLTIFWILSGGIGCRPAEPEPASDHWVQAYFAHIKHEPRSTATTTQASETSDQRDESRADDDASTPQQQPQEAVVEQAEVASEAQPESTALEPAIVEKPNLWMITPGYFQCPPCDKFKAHAGRKSHPTFKPDPELIEALNHYNLIVQTEESPETAWRIPGRDKPSYPVFVWPDASYKEGYGNPNTLIERLDQWRKDNPPETLEDKLSKADTQSTPWQAVDGLLRVLDPQPNKVLLDPGCGYDARLLIAACQQYGTRKAIGIEIDPVLAESARQHVAEAGLSDRIQIITGDSTKIDWEQYGIDIGVGYMFKEVLERMRPQIQKLDRFASYGFPVPGLRMSTTRLSNGGKVYLYEKPEPVARTPIYRNVIKHLPRGSYCQICGRYCSNPMAHVRMLVGSR